MKKVILLISMLIMLLVPAVCMAAGPGYPSMAVMPFANKAAISNDITFEDASIASDMVDEELVNSGYFDIVDRANLQSTCDEISLSMTGLVNQNTAVQVGNLIGAKYIVCGSISGLSTRKSTTTVIGAGADNYQVFAHVALRVIEVETGRVVVAASGDGKSTNTMVKAPLRLIRIGNDSVDQEQVYEALQQAATNAVNGPRGLLTKINMLR